jgi:hypothetical protein
MDQRIIFATQNVPEDIIRDNIDKVNLAAITMSKTLSEEFIRDFKEQLDWENVCMYQPNLSLALVKEFEDEMDWEILSVRTASTDPEIIREYQTKLNIQEVVECQTLPEDLLREFASFLDEEGWRILSMTQDLSEDFIRQYQDKVNWTMIVECQIHAISPEFALEFLDRSDSEEWQALASKAVKNYIVPNLKAEEILLVNVGTDERPAGSKDIEDIAEVIGEVCNNPKSDLVTHHAVSFTKYKIAPDQIMIIRVGSEERPAAKKDILNVQENLDKLKGSEDETKILVAHHLVDIDVVSRDWFKGKVETLG